MKTQKEEPTIWVECGVCYAWPEIKQDVPMRLPGWRIFCYGWRHAATGRAGIRYILCRSEKDFLHLLLFWNRDENWEYSLA